VLEAEVIVVRVAGATAWVAPQVVSACGGCSSAGSCGTGVLASLFSRRRGHFAVDNRLHSRIGDRLVVAVPDRLLTRASLVAYLMPLLCMLVPALLFDAGGAGNAVVALAALLGLLSGLVLLVFLDRASPMNFRPQVVRCATPGPGHAHITLEQCHD